MQVQEGALHNRINPPSTASLPDIRKPAAAVFDSPTCYSVQEKGSKAAPPPHLNAPALRTTNGVTTTALKRRRIMQRARDGPPNQHPCTTFSLGHPQACCSAQQPCCTSPRARGRCKSIPTPLPATKINGVTRAEQKRASACEYKREPSTFGSFHPRYLSRTSQPRRSQAGQGHSRPQ